VEIRANPWPFYSFKSYLMVGSQRMLCGCLSLTSKTRCTWWHWMSNAHGFSR